MVLEVDVMGRVSAWWGMTSAERRDYEVAQLRFERRRRLRPLLQDYFAIGAFPCLTPERHYTGCVGRMECPLDVCWTGEDLAQARQAPWWELQEDGDLANAA